MEGGSMQPVPVNDLSGKSMHDKVSLSWTCPRDAPEDANAVFICPIIGTGLSRKVNENSVEERLLCNAATGAIVNNQAISRFDVSRCDFLVFLAQSGSPLPEFRSLIGNPKFTVSVTVGSATVYYRPKTVNVENGFAKHIITLKSGFSIEEGILGYTFFTAGRRFPAQFPGAIERGKRKYPPFLTRNEATGADADVQVEVVNGSKANVTVIRM